MEEDRCWDAELVDLEDQKETVLDKWDGEDEEDVKDNWDDEEEELKEEQKKKNTETKPPEKKKLREKIKEKELLQRKEEEEEKKRLEDSQENTAEKAEEELAEKQLANELLGVSNHVPAAVDDIGLTSKDCSKDCIDDISLSSKDDFTEFERLLKEKICPYEKSIHYSGFLESLFRNLCLSLEVEDMKRINSSITILLGEKQKQEKQQNKGKKKKKGVVPAGGMKAKMKDDLDDYGEFDEGGGGGGGGGGYTQDFEDFM